MLFSSSIFLLASATLSKATYVASLSENAQSLFNESMRWMDVFYDEDAGYLFDPSSAAALHHETRASVWYSIGLLARNEGTDVDDAIKIITNTIDGQWKDPKDQWFGDYQIYPEQPTVGNAAYPPEIYNSWDPNWRGFIGTTLVVALEEFSHLLPRKTICLIEESLYNATVGDSYRVGGVDTDNLYPAYSNPSLMRAFVSGYVGHRLNDANMTRAGEAYASEILALFNRDNTLSEFNSGTYTGVSLFALNLWAKYLPANSTMSINGPRMMSATWKAVSQLWHPELKNVAGPWDRSYGFDMNRYLSILGLHFWNILGKEAAGFPKYAQTLSHYADFAIAPMLAVLASSQESLIPAGIVDGLTTFSGEHTFVSSTFSPPFDTYPRNITSYLASNLSIGAESFSENVIGGPAKNQRSFNPAVIQWQTGAEVGFITLYSTEYALDVAVAPGALNLTYPLGTNASAFSLLVSTFKKKVDVSKWEDLPGLDVQVSGNVNLTYSVGFAGAVGGSYTPINDFEFWNFTYVMPEGSSVIPSLALKVALK